MVYDGFISYSHAADGRFAPALQQGLQRLAKPWNSRRALRIFRDETGLSTNPHLWSAIEHALDESEWFVLLASPEAAQSEWVNKEISHWLATKSVDHILPVVTDGTWEWDPSVGDFTPASSAVPDVLRGALHDEPRHLDVRWARSETDLDLRNSRFRSAVADLAAPMHGVAKDELEGEDIRQHRRARRLARGAVSALAALVVISVVLGVVALASRNQAVKSRNQAISIGNVARARALAAESQTALSADPLISVLLARRAVQVSPIPQAIAALREAVDTSPARLALPTESGKQCGFQSGPAIAYSPAGDRIAESLCTGEVVVHDARTGRVLYRRHPATEASAVAYDPTGHLLAVGAKTGIALLDPATGHVEYQLDGHGEPNALAFSHNGALLAATTNLGTTLWDLKSRTPRFSLPDPHNDQTVSFTSDGLSLVVGTAGPTEVVDVADGRTVHRLSPPDQVIAGPGNVNPIAVSGNLLVVGENVTALGGVSAYIDLWDTRTWTRQSVVTPVTGTSVNSVAISSDGQRIAIGNSDGTGGVWLESPSEELVTLSGQTAYIGSITFSPSGAAVATASYDGTARIFRATGPWVSTQSAALCSCGNEIGWQKNKLVALARSGDEIRLKTWLQPAGRPMPDSPVLATNQQTLGAALSPDGKLAALWNDETDTTTMKVLDTATARVLFTLPATTVGGVTFSDDDHLLVVDDANGGMHVTTISSGHTTVGHGWAAGCAGFGSLAISRDDRVVAEETFAGHVCLGKTATATPFASFSQPEQLSSIAFNPAGNRLALASWDSSVTVLSVTTDKPAFQLAGHTHGVSGVAYSPDSRYIATTSTDETMRVWDARTGQLLQIDQDVFTNGQPSFSPDGEYVAESNADDQIRVWAVCPDCQDPAALLASSRSSVISPLNRPEQARVASLAN